MEVIAECRRRDWLSSCETSVMPSRMRSGSQVSSRGILRCRASCRSAGQGFSSCGSGFMVPAYEQVFDQSRSGEATSRSDPDRRRRLMVELLARTGMRAGEMGGIGDDAMYQVGDTWWLRIPIGNAQRPQRPSAPVAGRAHHRLSIPAGTVAQRISARLSTQSALPRTPCTPASVCRDTALVMGSVAGAVVPLERDHVSTRGGWRSAWANVTSWPASSSQSLNLTARRPPRTETVGTPAKMALASWARCKS